MGKTPVDAVETSLRVLRGLEQRAPCSVSELARRREQSKATVYYHLKTLEEHGFVVQRDEGYDLGLRVLDLGGTARARRRRAGVVQPNLKRLAREANEIAVFGVEERGSAVVLDAERPTGLTAAVDVTVGTHLPLHASALGKALLAALPEERRQSLIDGCEFERFTDETIPTESALREELSAARRDGHVHDHGERDVDVHGIAAPVASAGEGVPGAIGLVGPASRLYSDRFAHELPHLVERFAERVQHELRS